MKTRLGRSMRLALAVLLLVSPNLALAKDNLIIAIPGLPSGVDLDRHVSPQTWTMAAQLFESGMEWEMGDYPFESGKAFDPTNLEGYQYPIGYTTQNTTPALFESCEEFEGGQRVVYHIQPGIMSAWGNEFTADDVIWRYNREKELPIIYALVSHLFNTDTATKTKIDDYTVELTNDVPMPLACPGLTNFYNAWLDSKEVSRHASGDDPHSANWLATNGGGFGAYYVTEWSPGKRVIMEANPNYYKGEPVIGRITYVVVPESAGRLALLQRGEVDIAEGLSPDEINALADNESAAGVAVRGNSQMWLIANNNHEEMTDLRVRQAINYAIPRTEIVDNVYHGMAREWNGVISSVTPGYVESDAYAFDLKKARSLLEEAGKGDGFTLELAFSAGVPEMENMAVLLQDSLGEIGISLDLKKLPVAAHADLVQSRNAQLALWIDSPIQPDSNYVMSLVYSSGDLALVNYSNYQDDYVDAKLVEGSAIADAEERIEFHKDLQSHIREDAAFGWVVEPYFRIGVSRAITGFRWFTTQYYKVALMSSK